VRNNRDNALSGTERGRRRPLVMFGVALLAAAALAACSSSSSSSSSSTSSSSSSSASASPASASGSTIQVASIASLTGAASFAGWQLGAQVYFDWVNAHGGVNGHKINLTILDDAGSPTQDVQLARKEIDAGVVGFAGSISLSDCDVNGSYYDTTGTVVIDVGSDQACFGNPNIDPVNSGPQVDTELQMIYAAKVLHDTKVCLFTIAVPGEASQYTAALKVFTQVTGLQPTTLVENYPVTGNPAPAVLKFKNAGCQAVALPVEAIQGVPLLKDAAADGIHNITWLSGLSLYDPSFLSAAGSAANGLYVGLEFAPFNIAASDQMVAAFKAANVPISQPEESSYTAAYVFTQILDTIKGPITRASVLAAYKAMKPVCVPTLGTPMTFGTTAGGHHPNEASFFTKVVNGAFVNVNASESWFLVPGFTAPISCS
jgi:branched-chain amino acid transport system substrate-binding protein